MPRRMVSIASAPVTLVSWALVEGTDDTTEIAGVVQRAETPEKPNGWLGFADEVDGFQGNTFTGLAAPDH